MKCKLIYVLSVEEQLEVVQECGFVEAGYWVAFYNFGFDFFRFFIAFGRNYEFLSAVMTFGLFSGVFTVKGDERVAIRTIELNRHENLF